MRHRHDEYLPRLHAVDHSVRVTTQDVESMTIIAQWRDFRRISDAL
jgi:hypothetical protein